MVWTQDPDDETRDEWSDAIEAAHPMNSGTHKEFVQAEAMVHNRRGKYALVALVHWLLTRDAAPRAQPVAQETDARVRELEDEVAGLRNQIEWLQPYAP
jgi:hypothetical protein